MRIEKDIYKRLEEKYEIKEDTKKTSRLNEDWAEPKGDFAGWVAIYNGKRIEIGKDEANSIYEAKQIAIKKLKVPKSKIGLLAIKPGYNESLEEAYEGNIEDIDIDSIRPTKKDMDRAKGLAFQGGRFRGDGKPFGTEASKMAKLIKDPIKLVRRAMAVVLEYGADTGYVSNTGYSHIVSPDSETDAWGPFRKRLKEMGFNESQISKIENYQDISDKNESLEEGEKKMSEPKKYRGWDPDEHLKKVCEYYRKWAGFGEDEVLTEEMLKNEDWRLKRVSALKNTPVKKIKAELLKQKDSDENK